MTGNTLEGDINSLKAVGHGALSLVNAGIVLAIVAVALSSQAQTANAIQAMFAFLSWLVGAVIAPLQTVAPLTLSPALAPTAAVAFGAGTTTTGAATPAGSTGGLPVGTGTGAALPAGWSSTYAPGLVPAAITQPDGTVVYGYSSP